MPSSRHPSPWLIALIIVSAACIGGALAWLKSSGGHRLSPGVSAPHALALAVPDTTIDSNTLPAVPDTVAVAPSDSIVISQDPRPAFEAGTEDGYLTGMDDGATGDPQAHYDETSLYPTAAQREAYAKAYREGYAKGLADGLSGKQFNIGG